MDAFLRLKGLVFLIEKKNELYTCVIVVLHSNIEMGENIYITYSIFVVK